MMMASTRILYWDTTCFICFLNQSEGVRRLICEDILRHARMGSIELWTATWTLVEVVRPRRTLIETPPLPVWAPKLNGDGRSHFENIWSYFHRNTVPYERLTEPQITRIESMFAWPWLHKINVDERVASKAVELARSLNLKPADSVHAACAILKKVDALQRWDRDFDRVKHLLAVEEPQRITPQQDLIEDYRKAIGPAPEDNT
jgi:predicted nucleic acid-binding protein